METTDVERRLDQHDNDIRDTLVIVKRIDERQIEHGRILAEHGGLLAEQGRTLAEHGGLLAEHKDMLAAQAGVLAEHGAMLAEQAGVLSEHGAMLADIRTDLDHHTQILDSHTTALGNLNGKIDAISEEMDTKFRTVIGLLEKQGEGHSS